MLDEKLRKILGNLIDDFNKATASGRSAYWTQEPEKSIAQIKQAFAAEGYRPKSTQRLEKRFGLMTGAEWLDRFKREYRKLSPNAYAKDRYAKMAAEKASGLIDKYKED